MPYDLYVGVDWSGAHGTNGNGRCDGIKVAQCAPGNGPPTVVHHPDGWNWRRDEVLGWLNGQAATRRVLVGLDFAFAYPYCDVGAYFPGNQNSPATIRDLWTLVETICAAADWYYGGPFVAQGALLSAYFVAPAGHGVNYQSRYRVTEQACIALGARAHDAFHCVGPGRVGMGTLAGLRILNSIATNHAAVWDIWPFEARSSKKSTVVEVFPTHLQVTAGGAAGDITDLDVINVALTAYQSNLLNAAPQSDDEGDAILISAALRYLDANEAAVWQPGEMPECPRTHEGRIFGT